MKSILLLVIVAAICGTANGQQPNATATSALDTHAIVVVIPADSSQTVDGESVADGTKFGVGVGGSLLAWGGLSGQADLTNRITLQASLGALGTFTAFGGAVWYRFNQNDAYDLFAFGGASHIGGFGASTQGFGGGIGIEWDWGDLFNSEEFPPIFSNGTIGFYTYGDDVASLNAFWAGGGAHYRF